MNAVTLRVELLKHTPDIQETVSFAAKLCYSGAELSELKEGIESKDQSVFIQKLMDMGHQSPVEHVSFTFGVEGVSRSLLAQITRHRLASFSVQSQRYVSLSGENAFRYIIPPRIQALGGDAVAAFCAQMATMQGWYDEWCALLGDAGEKSNEDARFVLPNACETKMILTMNARELMHFFGLRCCMRAQWEIRALAWHMLALCIHRAPALFASAGPACASGAGCTEGPKSCKQSARVKKLAECIRGLATEPNMDDDRLKAGVEEALQRWENKA
ncbi:MAG: FAD-dependent thymidylate synthase [Christensenellales bacterium]|jgi:thymidylate synthase (FAD)